MANCPECSSEITEAEAFCPYCGISLQPVVFEEKEEKKESIHEIIDEDSVELKSDEEVIKAVTETVDASTSDADETIITDEDDSMSETIMVNPNDLISEVSEPSKDNKPSEQVISAEPLEPETINSSELVQEPDDIDQIESIEADAVKNVDSALIEDKDVTVNDKPIIDTVSADKETPSTTTDTASEDKDSIEPTSNVESNELDITGKNDEEVQIETESESTNLNEKFETESPIIEDVIKDDAPNLNVENENSAESPIKVDDNENQNELVQNDSEIVNDNASLESIDANPQSAQNELETDKQSQTTQGEVESTEKVEAEEKIELEVNKDQSFNDEEIATDVEFDTTVQYVPPKDLDIPNEKEIEVTPVSDNIDLQVSNEVDEKIVEQDEQAVEKVINVQDKDVQLNEEVTTTNEQNESVDNDALEAQTFIKKSSEIDSTHLQNDISEADLVENQEVSSSTTPNIGKSDTDGNKGTKLKPLNEGTILNGRYKIVRKIGGGGMGAVYLASDKNLGGVLRAVKEMVQSYIEEEQQDKAIQDFKRESMLLTSLEHTAIPTIYDYFFDEIEGRFYLVMKYISGGDLAARLKAAPEGRLDEKGVVEWGIQVADVLDYLHNRQPPIVYRDLKPANVMIDGNSGRIMLIDFGIARWVNKEEKGVTAVGTMGYAPPELFSGNVEPRSDVYSLGSTMFHLLTGADPQSNPLLIFDFQKHPRPRQINPNLSDQIERILMRAVEYNADKRFESAGQMRDSLIKHLEQLNAGQASFGVKQTPQPVGLEEQPVFCGFCGQRIVASDMFCAFCGAKQPLAQPGVQSSEYVQTKTTARLILAGTSELDSPSFLLEKNENLVGRRDPLSNIFPEVDLSKFDPQTKISRKHARIWKDGETFLVEDLGSSNGTMLISDVKDSVKLEPNKAHMLTDGDKIKMGDTTLHFLVQ